jgi:upstream activation factor subunit UAF30
VKEEDDNDEELSDVPDTPPPKKKQRKNSEIDDAAFAAKLQAEENSRARPTRGGAMRKAAPVKKKAPKKKTAARVKGSDDSEVESGSGAEKKVNRSGGFHKPLTLSAPLSALLDGETQVSFYMRPRRRPLLTFRAALATTDGQTNMGICEGTRSSRSKGQATDSM